MRNFTSITVHPEIQDGAPVFAGTRVRIETFCDFLRIGVSVNEFLNEFPSITRDQAMEVYELISQQYTLDQLAYLAQGKGEPMPSESGRVYSVARG